MLAAARQYTFRVDPRSTAPAIAAAIESLYSVGIIGIRTSHRIGKVTRYKGRSGRRVSEKRAIVTLKVGERIAGFEVEKPEPEKTKMPATPLRSALSGASEGQATSRKTGVTTTVRTAKSEVKDKS